LGDVAGAGDARGVGLEEVGLVERAGVGDAGEDDEEEEDERGGKQDETRGTETSVYSEEGEVSDGTRGAGGCMRCCLTTYS
jgi:hypothetical protein